MRRPRGLALADAPAALHPAARAVVWGLVYFLAGQVGLMTTLPDRPLALVTPTTGVLVLWFAFSTRVTLPYDLAALATAGMLIAYQLDMPWPLVFFNPLISLAEIAVFVLLMRALAPDLAPLGGRREKWRMNDLWAFLAASTAAALVVATLSTGSQSLAGLATGDLATFLTRWGRSVATIVALGSVGLLCGPALRRAVRERRVAAWLRARLVTDHAHRVELGALTVCALAAWTTCFFWLDHLPLTFLLFVPIIWAGLRLSPLGAATYALLGGTAIMFATLGNQGVFAVLIDDPAQRAVVAQLFVLVTVITALSLSVTRSQLLDAEALAESRLRMLDQVLAEVTEGITLVQDDGKILIRNGAVARLFGPDYDPELLPSVGELGLHDADGAPLVEDQSPFQRALRGEPVLGEDFELRRPDESDVRYLRISAKRLPVLDPAVQTRVLLTSHDITGDRLRQDALAKFAGHVAHDLRNPLSVIEAWNELLSDSAADGGTVTPEEVAAMTGKIGAAAARMRDFLKGLLDYTLARDRALALEPVDMVALATDVAELRMQTSSDAGLPTITVLGAGTVMADRELIRIVLDNLVANACKYVASGVRPRVIVLVEQVDALTLEISVTDNGIGIPADQRTRIFESFHRIESGGRIEGTGLGLGICQRIVERHGGTITVEDVTEGATLRVTLPRAVGVSERPPEQGLPLVAG